MSNPFLNQGQPQQPTAPVIQPPPPQMAAAQNDPTFGGRIQDPVNQGTRVTIFPIIAAYPHLFTPKAGMNEGDEAMYQLEIWIPKNDPSFMLNMNALNFAVTKAATGFQKWQGKIPTFNHQPFRDLEVKNEPPDIEGYFLNAKSKSPPGVAYNSAPPGATPNLTPVLDQKMVYPGVICAVALNAYAYDKKGGKGVAWALNNVVILKDGVRIGGGPRPVTEEFSGIAHALPFGAIGGQTAAGNAAAQLPPQPGMQQQPWQQQAPAPPQQWGGPPQQPQQWGVPGQQLPY